MRWCRVRVTANSTCGWPSRGVCGKSATWIWKKTVEKVSRPEESGICQIACHCGFAYLFSVFTKNFYCNWAWHLFRQATKLSSASILADQQISAAASINWWLSCLCFTANLIQGFLFKPHWGGYSCYASHFAAHKLSSSSFHSMPDLFSVLYVVTDALFHMRLSLLMQSLV